MEGRNHRQRRRRRTARRRRLQSFVFIAAILSVILFFWLGGQAFRAYRDGLRGGWDTEPIPPAQQPDFAVQQPDPIPASSQPPALYSVNALLLRLDDGKVLLDQQADERIYPASLTKIMTVLVAIEHLDDFDERITLPEEIFTEIWRQNASTAGFQPGEEVPAIDLLYGAMLPSGADASMGLAVSLAGSEREFVRWMNERAGSLGMEHTVFTNTSGLQDEGHYSTLRDLSLLLREALQNDTFRNIFTASRRSTASTNLHPDGITFYSTLFSAMDDLSFPGGEILGGKTGFTDEAGLCLASLAEKDGVEYILLTAGADGDHKTEPFHILDAIKAYEWI